MSSPDVAKGPLGCQGEKKREKGRLFCVGSLNLNSLKANPDVLTWEPEEGERKLHVDCWALQEVRIVGKDVATCKGLAATRGRHLALGPAGKPSKSGQTQGGVAVACDTTFPIEVCWDYDSGAAARLLKSGRFVHARVHINKARCINVCSLYAPVDQQTDEGPKRERESIFNDAFEYLASLGDAPTLLMGDFNTLVEDSMVLQGALATGEWVDVAARFGKTEPTYVEPRQRGDHAETGTGRAPSAGASTDRAGGLGDLGMDHTQADGDPGEERRKRRGRASEEGGRHSTGNHHRHGNGRTLVGCVRCL